VYVKHSFILLLREVTVTRLLMMMRISRTLYPPISFLLLLQEPYRYLKVLLHRKNNVYFIILLKKLIFIVKCSYRHHCFIV